MYHPCREHRGCRAQRARRRHNHRAVRRVSEDALPLFWKSLEKLFSSNTTLLLVRGQHLDGAPTPPPKHHPSSNGIFYFCRNVATFFYFCIGPHLAFGNSCCQSQGGQNAGVVKKKKSPAQTKHTEDVGRGTACGTLLRINAPSTPVYNTSDEFCGRCARSECARNRNPFHLCREAHVRAPLSAPVAHIHGKEPASAMPCSFP